MFYTFWGRGWLTLVIAFKAQAALPEKSGLHCVSEPWTGSWPACGLLVDRPRRRLPWCACANWQIWWWTVQHPVQCVVWWCSYVRESNSQLVQEMCVFKHVKPRQILNDVTTLPLWIGLEWYSWFLQWPASRLVIVNHLVPHQWGAVSFPTVSVNMVNHVCSLNQEFVNKDMASTEFQAWNS